MSVDPPDAPMASPAVGPRPTTRARRVPVGMVLAGTVLLIVVLWALFPTLFAGQDPLNGVPADKLQPPSTAHWFGTDHLGRDVFARAVHGARLSLQASVVAVGVGFAGGTLLGLVAGSAGGRVDAALMRVVDVLLAVPGLLLSLTVVVALGFGTMSVAVGVGVGSIATFARLMRAEVLRVRALDYVEASSALGRRWSGVLTEHVLPNAAGPVLALVTIELGAAILAVSALSFLGFGAQPPAPEWGQMVADGRDHLATSWWLTTLPGAVVIVVVLAANRLGHGVRTAGRGRP